MHSSNCFAGETQTATSDAEIKYIGNPPDSNTINAKDELHPSWCATEHRIVKDLSEWRGQTASVGVATTWIAAVSAHRAVNGTTEGWE